MNNIKVIIVGGVAGGATAAARLRRLDENAQIIMFEKGEYISYANCGLPYYIGDVIKEKDRLLVQTPESFNERFNIDIRINTEVLSIDKENKKVKVLDKISNKEYEEIYDKLVLSPGADPIKPPIPGLDGNNIFTLRSVPDTYKIKEYIEKNNVKKAVVVGAGFIGIEMAENIHNLSIQTTIVELSDHVMGPLDYDMAALVHQHMKTKKVEFYLNDGVKEVLNQAGTTVVLNSGKHIRTDMVVLAIGVRPDVRLAKDAGLSIGPRGGIEVNEYLQTSNPDIYAIGDAIEVNDYINGNKTIIPLAGPANKQGRIAADNICGFDKKYEGTQGSSIIKVFDLTVAGTGNNENTLKRYNIPYKRTYIHTGSHAGYYPGATPISIKLIFSPHDGKVLGSQIIGYDGVDKRIDVIATAIRASMTVFDLEKLELSYAPPYSSAKDPVNLAGYTAANILKDIHKVIHWDEIDTEGNAYLLDVRTIHEHNIGAIPNSINIPVDELRAHINEIPKDKKIIIYCEVGLRGYVAQRILLQNGFADVVNLSGGYKTYSLAKQKQSNEDIFDDTVITRSDLIKADSNEAHIDSNHEIMIDACGLQCPGPIIQVYKKISEMASGDTLKVTATDPGFESDIKVWCSQTKNQLLSLNNDGKTITAVIKKGTSDTKSEQNENVMLNNNNGKTMVIFSNDLDRAIASFIIANGAAAMGYKVTMFFTFWGLSILKKEGHVSVSKSFLEKMFGVMLPKGSKHLHLSKMNMSGIGGKMIRYIMKSKNVLSLEELIEEAKNLGVKLIACNMSMDIMGFKKEELFEGVEIGGVATFIDSADKSNMSLFI